MRFRKFALLLVVLVAALGPVLFSQGFTTANPGMYWVPPSACISAVSGNSTGTNGQTVSGASNMPVVQAHTSVTGTNTHTYICNITPPNGIITTRTGYAVLDAIFTYGVQGTALGTQAATLASGTMNSSIIFSYVAYPTPAGAETPSTVTPVRADTGTIVIAPVVASFNTTSTTAGSFYALKFTPATPIAWKTDKRQLLLTVTLQALASQDVVTNSSGVLVHLTTR
jgi:hypothetical protein